MSNRQRLIDRIIGRLERIGAGKMDGAIDALLDRRWKIDGWPNPGEVHVQNTAELTPVEATVAARQAIDQLIRNLDEELDAIDLIARNLEHDCDRYLRADLPDTPKPRCDGGVGYEGYLIARTDGGWSNPGCHEIPDDGRKTCNRCRGAASSWKRARDSVAKNG